MMKNIFQTNEGELDRFIRAALGVLLLLLGAFWAAGWWRVSILAVAGITLFTAASGFCGVYVLLGINTRKPAPKPLKRGVRAAWLAGLALLAVGGTVGGYLLNAKSFKQDFAALNTAYKQVLFLSGQESTDAAKAQGEFEDSLRTFKRRQLEYRPWVIRDSGWLRSKIDALTDIATASGNEIRQGRPAAAHRALEQARPIFQEVMRAAGVSELAVALINFHDAMEDVIDAANSKDLAGVVRAYTEADAKLKAIETLADDSGIKAIRQALDLTLQTASQPDPDKLPEMASKLKAAFVKVYLERG